jgi:hypothetical protein
LRGIVGGLFRFRADGKIDIWTEREADAPVGHGEIGIIFERAIERTNGGVVIESKNKREPLIEETLRHGVRGGDRVMQIAELLEKRNGFGRCNGFGCLNLNIQLKI